MQMLNNIFSLALGNFLHSYKKKFATYNHHEDSVPQLVKLDIVISQIIRQAKKRFFVFF